MYRRLIFSVSVDDETRAKVLDAVAEYGLSDQAIPGNETQNAVQTRDCAILIHSFGFVRASIDPP
jgi:hypothetical protein